MLRTDIIEAKSQWAGDDALAMHFEVESEPGYWAEIERDLDAHPEIWPLMDYEALA
ncbi:MAG: hypothetical protein AAFR68_18470 [Pseudomonadota bacterium]